MKLLSSSLFQRYPEIRFGISTRLGGVSTPPYDLNLSFSVGDERSNVIRNRDLFFGRLRISWEEVAIPGQCHSSSVLRADSGGGYDNCDALVTNEIGVFLTVSVADCVPLFLFDPKNKAVAAVHVGWRGAAQGIVFNAVKRLEEEFSTDPGDLVAFLGPAAGVCCYEVGDEVAGLFDVRFLRNARNQKRILDLQSFVRHELEQEGARPRYIETSEYCTICKPELFHSYRREGKRSGRMMGIIGLVQ
ncbi:MAG: peptidoglycan editing factor PgeF [Bacteroidota bacterium]